MRSRRRALSALLALIGLVGLAGWIFQSDPLRQWVPPSPPVSASSCLAFLIVACTFFFLEETRTARGRIQTFVGSASIFVLSALSLADRIAGSSLAADYLLFPHDPSLAGIDARGRMSLANAVAFLLVSGALLLAGRRMRGDLQPSAWFFHGSGSIGLIAALGYAFNDPSLSGFPGFHQVSLPGSIGMLVLSATGLLAWPETGLMAILTGRGPGAILARRLLFPASAVLILTAFARSVGVRRGFYSPEFGSAAFVVVNLVLLATLVAVTAERLQRAAAERTRAEERFRTLIESAPVAISVARDGKTIYANRKYGELYGFPSLDELRGRPISEQWAPQCRPEIAERARQRALGLPVATEYEAIGQRRDGTQFPVHSAATVVQLADGPATIGFLEDITERKRAQEGLKRSYEELRALAVRMETVREEEASRIAHELHDEIGQALTAVKIHLQTLQQRREASAFADELGESVSIAARALEQVRDLSLALRPSVLDHLGLAAALRWDLDRQAQLSGLSAEFSAHLPPERLARELETACFRVGQQAVTNVTRHAHARRVSMEVRVDETHLWLSVRDDGAGFDVAAARARALSGQSLGILGMEERVSVLGGAFEVSSKSPGGTEVRARFPVAWNRAPTGDS